MLESLGRFSDRLFDRVRSKHAFAVSNDNAIDGDFDCLRGHKYAVLVTFRRNGEAVPSPVWYSVDERGKAYIKTRHDAGKVKRLRNDSRAVIVASDMRGETIGVGCQDRRPSAAKRRMGARGADVGRCVRRRSKDL
jgi:PPOX class probable F420-dependent enzyme